VRTEDRLRERASNDCGGVVKERNFHRLLLDICSETLDTICRTYTCTSYAALRLLFSGRQMHELLE